MQSGAVEAPRNTPGHSPMKRMPDPSVTDLTVWEKLFEQTPVAIRWAFTVLSLGGFGLVRMLWKRSQENVERVERQIHARMDREMGQLHDQIATLQKSVDTMNSNLIQIVNNTRRD